MKRFLLFSLILLSLTSFAQNKKVVNGRVYDESGLPIKGSIISPIGGAETFAVQADGSFSISVDVYCRKMEASAPGYIPVQMEVDGSYLIFKLKVDKDAQEKAEKAREAARQKAEEERIAKEKAEEAARVKAENDRIAKEKAEENARIQAEKERIAKEKAQEAARVKAENERIAKEKAEKAARVKAENKAINAKKKQERKEHLAEANKRYNARFRNKGLINSIEFSYNYQLATRGKVIFTNFGFHYYDNMNPVTAEYLIGYRFNTYFELNAGVGFHYNISNLYNIKDQISTDLYGEWNYRTWDIPVLLNMKVYCSRTKVQPMISISGGYYCMSQKILYEAGLGCNFRISKRSNFYILATIKSTPWPEFNSPAHDQSDSRFDGYNRYKETLSPGIKIGFSL